MRKDEGNKKTLNGKIQMIDNIKKREKTLIKRGKKKTEKMVKKKMRKYSLTTFTFRL